SNGLLIRRPQVRILPGAPGIIRVWPTFLNPFLFLTPSQKAIYTAAAVFLQEGNPAVGVSFFAPDRKRSMSLQKPTPTLGFLGSSLFRFKLRRTPNKKIISTRT
ncbi:MAG: hypothetical protein ACLFMN_06175, partial [Desulfobacterales bacterium]